MRAVGTALTITLIAASTVSLIAATPYVRRTHADWTATLAGKDGRKVTGQASAAPTADGTGTVITVTIEGDTPGATRPWHVHTGTCTKGGGVVGGGRVYTPLAIDNKGHASSKATLTVPLADTTTYNVNIHDSAAAMGIIVACGDLAKR
jgi:superoxide dismutase, Cu-Zn family